jgi:hypothetical protein
MSLKVNQQFGEGCRLHPHGLSVGETRNERGMRLQMEHLGFNYTGAGAKKENSILHVTY